MCLLPSYETATLRSYEKECEDIRSCAAAVGQGIVAWCQVDQQYERTSSR